jgi:hypothetical protein
MKIVDLLLDKCDAISFRQKLQIRLLLCKVFLTFFVFPKS